MADLEALAATARAKGWASGSGDIESVREQAGLLGWVEVVPRRGDATVSVLRPVIESAAHPNSLSAVYGLGQQQLHTDGAHLQVPPDVLVFICDRPSATSTQLWRPDVPARRRRPLSTTSALSHGMFLVRNGRDSFYAPALSGSGYLRCPGRTGPQAAGRRCGPRRRSAAGPPVPAPRRAGRSRSRRRHRGRAPAARAAPGRPGPSGRCRPRRPAARPAGRG